MRSVVPTFCYHPTDAPMGRKFTDQAVVDALGPDWVDTPAKFQTHNVPADQEKTGEYQEKPGQRRGRGRPRKETV